MTIKRGHRQNIETTVTRLQSNIPHGFNNFFGNNVTIIPVPRSSASIVRGGVRPTQVIAEELISKNLGMEISPCLIRTKTVPKSAFCRPGERPDVDTLYNSLTVNGDLIAPERILIIDDVVTVGRNLIASASKLQVTFPDAEIRAFALIRHVWEEVTNIETPVVGNIECNNGHVGRHP